MAKLYRVVVEERKGTGPVNQRNGVPSVNRTVEVLYCGYDRDKTREVYHRSAAKDWSDDEFPTWFGRTTNAQSTK